MSWQMSSTEGSSTEEQREGTSEELMGLEGKVLSREQAASSIEKGERQTATE